MQNLYLSSLQICVICELQIQNPKSKIQDFSLSSVQICGICELPPQPLFIFHCQQGIFHQCADGHLAYAARHGSNKTALRSHLFKVHITD